MKNLAIFCFIFAFLGSHLIAGKSVGNSVNLKENLVSKDDKVENPGDINKPEPTVDVNDQKTNATEPIVNPGDINKPEPTVDVNDQKTNATEPIVNPDDINKPEPTVDVNDQKTNATEPIVNPDDINKPEPTVDVNDQKTNATEPIVNPDDSNKSEPTVDVTTPETEKTTHKPEIGVPATDTPGTTKAPTTESLVKHKYKMSGGATAGIIVAVLAVFVVLGGVYYHYSSKRLPKTKNASMSLKESRSKAFNKDS